MEQNFLESFYFLYMVGNVLQSIWSFNKYTAFICVVKSIQSIIRFNVSSVMKDIHLTLLICHILKDQTRKKIPDSYKVDSL